MTFKDLRRIIEENQKLDDDKIANMRLRLWPAERGNGNSRNNNYCEWKGRSVISNEHWKKLAGYTELHDLLIPDEKMLLKMSLAVDEDVLSKEVFDRVNAQMIRQINPKALQYFPQDLVRVVFNSDYSCPKASDLYKEWVSDYREFLIARG